MLTLTNFLQSIESKTSLFCVSIATAYRLSYVSLVSFYKQTKHCTNESFIKKAFCTPLLYNHGQYLYLFGSLM